METFAVEITLPGQQHILVSIWYSPPESSNFPQSVGFSDSESQTELQQLKIICADLNAHGPLWNPVARHTERVLAEMLLDADSAFLNTHAPTHLNHSAAGFTVPDVTIIHESLQELY